MLFRHSLVILDTKLVAIHSLIFKLQTYDHEYEFPSLFWRHYINTRWIIYTFKSANWKTVLSVYAVVILVFPICIYDYIHHFEYITLVSRIIIITIKPKREWHDFDQVHFIYSFIHFAPLNLVTCLFRWWSFFSCFLFSFSFQKKDVWFDCYSILNVK